MAYNTLEYLEAGNIDFIYDLPTYDYNNLIKYVRQSDRKINIINGFLAKLINSKPRFCFEIIYDEEEFINEAKYLLNTYYSVESFDEKQLTKLLNNSSLGQSFLINNFDEIINKFKTNLNFILKYLFNNFDKYFNLLKQLSIHSNLHIRFLFMKYLIENYPQGIDMFYDDITKYLTNFTHQEFEQLTLFTEYMDMKDICELAYLYLENNINYEIWLKFKKFILDNYKYNDLAFHLLSLKKKHLTDYSYNLIENSIGIEEFNKDASTLFDTSANYRLFILKNYSEKVSNELLESYKKQLVYFKQNGTLDRLYNKIEIYGLGRTLANYVDRYLSLSNNQTYSHIENGSTASCYRIGDFVFKLIKTKWSYEDIICPNLYLILPNLEEHLIRDKEGIVLAGLEIQKYLQRDATNIPPYVFSDFKSELFKLGYYVNDELMNGQCGDNCRLLDDYIESGNPNPPEWFKDYPLVLVDRDRVYKNNNKHPKQLNGRY